MRHERRSLTLPSLAGEMGDMVTILERHRGPGETETEGRKLRECVAVMIWEEADGTETIEIVGNPDVNPLEMKGVLHDGIYALAHEGDSTP